MPPGRRSRRGDWGWPRTGAVQLMAHPSHRLIVEQQPKRARMCGFGDKDRRPITPPPCVKLVVTDAKGKEVDVKYVARSIPSPATPHVGEAPPILTMRLASSIDHGMFVLNVDLWNADGTREVNLVRHSSGTPSISSTTQASYGSLTSSTAAYANILPSHRESSYPGPEMGGQYGQPVIPQYGMHQGYAQAASPYGQGPQSGYQRQSSSRAADYTTPRITGAAMFERAL